MPLILSQKINKDNFLKITGDVIDLELGARLVNSNETFAKEMIDNLVKDLKTELPNLQIAYAKSDWVAIQSIAHKLHGGVCCCGTPRLRKAFVHLENCLKNTEIFLRETLFKQLFCEIDLVVNNL